MRKEVERAVAAYVHAVKDRSFPNPEREGYAIDPTEWESFLHAQAQEAQHAKEQRLSSAASHREDTSSAEAAQPADSRASAVSRGNELGEQTDKKAELHTQ